MEKAIKALLIQRHVQFPYVHDIAELLTVLETTGQAIPQAIRQAERLTRFAVFTRYPGIAPPISRESPGVQPLGPVSFRIQGVSKWG